MTETRMEETTSSLPSRIRDQLLLGADRDTPANTELQIFDSWVARHGSPGGRNEWPSLASTQPHDHPVYGHGQAQAICSQQQGPRSWPPLSANHSPAPWQGTSTNPADALAGRGPPFCLLLLHTCKTVSLPATPGIWSGSHPAFLYLKDILRLIKRKWNLPKKGKWFYWKCLWFSSSLLQEENSIPLHCLLA